MLKSQILTERQQLELNKAIVQYLDSMSLDADAHIVNKLLETLRIPINSIDENVIPNYLEKKWSTVLRLQRKIIDLENEVSNLRTVIDSQSSVNGTSSTNTIISKDKINWLPFTAAKTFQTQQLIQTNCIHPILPVIVGGCTDGTIIFWNLSNDETSVPDKILKAHTRSVNRLVWSPKPITATDSMSDYILASCSSDLTIKIWNGSNYKHIRTLTGHEHTISSVKFSEESPSILYLVSRDKTVKIWDLANGYCLKSFIGHSEWVRDLDIISIQSDMLFDILKHNTSTLGDFIITCSNDHLVRLLHAESGTGLALLIGHKHVVEAVKFLPLISNKTIDKYLTDNQTLFPSIPPEIILDKIYTEKLGYKYCVSASRDNTIKLWLLPPPILVPHRNPLPSKLNNSQAWLIGELIGHQLWVKALGVHPNGRFIFSGGDDKTIKIWDLESLNIGGKVRCIRTLLGHDGFVNDLQFALPGRGKDEKQLTIGKPEELNEHVLKYIESKLRCLFISCGSDNSIKLWS